MRLAHVNCLIALKIDDSILPGLKDNVPERKYIGVMTSSKPEIV